MFIDKNQVFLEKNRHFRLKIEHGSGKQAKQETEKCCENLSDAHFDFSCSKNTMVPNQFKNNVFLKSKQL